MKSHRRVKVERPNVPLPCTEFLIQPLGPYELSQPLNYDIIEFPEEGNPKLSNQIVSKPEEWEGPNGQHSRAGNSTTEGFETVYANQEDIWPLYPHSTSPILICPDTKSFFWRDSFYILCEGALNRIICDETDDPTVQMQEERNACEKFF